MEYRIDTQPLEVLRESNYFMSILECLQPSGEIPAGRTIPVQFVFSPLEAKRYTVGHFVLRDKRLCYLAASFMLPDSEILHEN